MTESGTLDNETFMATIKSAWKQKNRQDLRCLGGWCGDGFSDTAEARKGKGAAGVITTPRWRRQQQR